MFLARRFDDVIPVIVGENLVSAVTIRCAPGLEQVRGRQSRRSGERDRRSHERAAVTFASVTEPGSQLRSRAWQDVDGSTSPSEFADYLDALEQASSASRLESVLLLGIEAGGAALDVGCGTGKVVIDLGRLVATGGRAVGVDVSKAMIATVCSNISTTRAARSRKWRACSHRVAAS